MLATNLLGARVATSNRDDDTGIVRAAAVLATNGGRLMLWVERDDGTIVTVDAISVVVREQAVQ